MKKGFDTAIRLAGSAGCLVDAGYAFAGRYYNINNPAKNLTLNEAKVLCAAGLSLIAIWENGYPTSAGYFSHDQGVKDGTAAFQYGSQTIGQPGFTPIYFTVDYDATPDDLNGVITDYFKGIQDGFNAAGSNYLIGVYGSGLTCQTLQNANLAAKYWLAQAMNWRGSSTYTAYDMIQAMQVLECGDVEGDPNSSPNDTEGAYKV